MRKRFLRKRINEYECKKCGHKWKQIDKCNCGTKCSLCAARNKPVRSKFLE